MEIGTFFLAATAFIGICHFAASASKALAKNRPATWQAKPRVRDDWYCFFSRSALLGTKESAQIHAHQNVHARRRPQPRLYT